MKINGLRAAVAVAAALAATSLSASSADSRTTWPETAARSRVNETYGKLPLSFEANQGQTDPQVKFLARGSGYTLYLTSEEMVLALSRSALLKTSRPASLWSHPREPEVAAPPQVVRIRFLGGNRNVEVSGLKPLPGRSHYFIGNDPKQWHTNVPHYTKVRYKNVYPGVDIVFYGSERELEFDVVVAPRANPKSVKLGFQGTEAFKIEAGGDLILYTAEGELRQTKPFIYQEFDGKRKIFPGRYVRIGRRQVGFEVEGYDPERSLTMDPVLSFSTYLGGSAEEAGRGVAVDSSGNAYVSGYTRSPNYPTQSPFQSVHGGGSIDAVVTKFNPAGSALVYSTYLGGGGGDVAVGIAVDTSGNAYVSGNTDSTNFPTQNPFQPANAGGGDVFLAKLDSAGSALVYSTYLGESGTDLGGRIAVDSSGNAYVTGFTFSTNFPTKNPFQPMNGGLTDAFVAKFNPAGSDLVYSTYLGGSLEELSLGIKVDSLGSAYVTGTTRSTNFPTQSPLQPVYGGGSSDAFVTKLNATGAALDYSTFLGGSSSDLCESIAIDGLGMAYVTGRTNSINFPIQSPFQPASGGGDDAFVTKINAPGSAPVYSTYLGGGAFDQGLGITVDSSGNAYVTGGTGSPNFPMSNSLQPVYGGGADAFVTKFNAAGSALVYSTYLGGSGDDQGSEIAVDSSGNAYVRGITSSANFPTRNPFQPTNGGGQDLFVAKISDTPTGLDIPTLDDRGLLALALALVAAGLFALRRIAR